LTNPIQLVLDFDCVSPHTQADVAADASASARANVGSANVRSNMLSENGSDAEYLVEHEVGFDAGSDAACDAGGDAGDDEQSSEPTNDRPELRQAQVRSEPNGFVLAPQLDSNGLPRPIPYQLKQSPKARQVYLRVEPGRGLQVTIPKRYPKRSIPALVESQRDWITAALIDLDKKTPAIYRQWPPPQLQLNACRSVVNVRYTDTPSAISGSATWESPTDLHLVVDTNNKPMVAQFIAAALKPRAAETLGPWLERCAARSRLCYKRMVIRGQRTVWGSYSSSGTLSLNYKLLFVNPDIVDYVLLHELAHTRHLDHSAAFWRFLDGLIPNSRQVDRQLKEAGTQVPPWLELVGSG